MQFTNEFAVQAPIDEVWAAVLDVERVAPCVPGAQVLDKTGDDAYKVGIKVKLGPITQTYRGEMQIVERHPDEHRAIMSAKAKEARGQGTADAKVEMRLDEEAGETHGTITAEVQLKGKAAAMGRGIIEDVSRKLIETFAGNLAAMLGGGDRAEAEAAGASAGAAGASANGGAAPEATIGATPAEPEGEGQERPAEPEGEGQERPAEPSRPPLGQAPPAESELSATDLIGTVVMGRLRDPRALAASFGVVALVFFLLGRRSAR